MKLKCKYEYSIVHGTKTHVYSAVGGAGAVHVHFREYHDGSSILVLAGFEIHSRTPFSHAPHNAHSDKCCWLLGGPCWHDGSLTYAQEVLLPRWEIDRNDHDGMFRLLEAEYVRLFVDVEKGGA